MANSTEPLLSVRGVTVRFGGIVALDGVSFDVRRGDVCGLIGPNGAGKTTLFNCLSRLYQYQAGDILFEGKSITNTPTHQIAGLGLGRTFQNLAMFKTMPVRENVMIGGEPLDPAKTYTLACHDYLLKNAGDGYTMFQDNALLLDAIMLDNQVLINYIVDGLGGVVGADYTDPYGQGRIVAVATKP